MNNKYIVVALFGKAGSGKSYLLKHLIEHHPELNRIVQVTTRPPRAGQQEGVDYYFKQNVEDFFKIKTLIESNSFRFWWYGTDKKTLKQDKINIGIFNIPGICQMLSNSDIKVIPIYLNANSRIRLIRQLNREENPDCYEIARRYIADENDFLNIPFSYNLVINNYDELIPIEAEILDIIKKKSQGQDEIKDCVQFL